MSPFAYPRGQQGSPAVSKLGQNHSWALKSALSSPYVPIRERLYFAQNTRSRIPGAVLGTTYIYINLNYSSVKGARFGNNFIFLVHMCRRGIKLSLVELGCPSLMRITVEVVEAGVK